MLKCRTLHYEEAKYDKKYIQGLQLSFNLPRRTLTELVLNDGFLLWSIHNYFEN